MQLSCIDATASSAKDTGLADLDGIKRNWTLRGLIIIWISAGLMSFVTNLNNTSSSTFAPYATSSFSSAPLVGTIAVVQAVIASGSSFASLIITALTKRTVSLQPLARFADVYGYGHIF
ncbi:siderophore iron transporter [Penicillium lagena]|uniref:siderophore iron transporter n=1 Tax=Penicillium lagena TaxID=94218 RepID=UPI002541FBC8|nr:siderophore iron transporter [Penicillium lagena]KAJ5619341.1 siderophore iron transporter [Penicillium lagena]